MSEPTVTAYVIGDATRPANSLPTREEDEHFKACSALLPPHDVRLLYRIFEESSILGQIIDAYKVNVHGRGFRLEPEIDLTAKDADEKIRLSIIVERIIDGKPPIATPEEVAARRAEIEVGAPIERMQLELFFRYAAGSKSWNELLDLRREEIEAIGYACWEVLRNPYDEVTRFEYVPALTVRLMPVDGTILTIEEHRKVSPINYRAVSRSIRGRDLRRYVQLSWGRELVYFKSFGDPRLMCADDGEFYPSIAAMKNRAGEHARVATELMFFTDDLAPPYSDYGIPRWVQCTLAVQGTRESEEANLHLLLNHATPSAYICVSGGKLAKDAAEKIKQWHTDNASPQMRGRPCVIEAESASAAPAVLADGRIGSNVRIEIIPVRNLAAEDALFQGMEANNARKVQARYRLPDLIVGRSEETNRAQAQAVIEMSEQQVFSPIRERDDHMINSRIMAARRARYHKYVTCGPKVTDPPALVAMIVQLCEAGVLTGAEARELVGAALGRSLPPVTDAWAQVPIAWVRGAALQGAVPALNAEEVVARRPPEGETAHGEENTVAPAAVLTAAREHAKFAITVDDARHALGLPLKGGAEGAELLAQAEAKAKAAAAPKPELGQKPPGMKKPEGDAGGSLVEAVKSLRDLRETLVEADRLAEKAGLEAARRVAAQEPVHMTVPAATMREWVES